MMRLPTFAYHAPQSVDEATKIIREDNAVIVAGKSIPISRSQRPNLMKRLNIL